MCFVRWFSEVGRDDVAVVGGKVAALGEFRRALAPAGIDVPDGFAVTTEAFHAAFEHADMGPVVTAELPPSVVGGADLAALDAATARVRARFLGVPLPEALEAVVLDAHRQLLRSSAATRVAVRSSATTEDLATSSFAGAHTTVLDVADGTALLDAVRQCFASLYTTRAVRYRHDRGVAESDAALAVAVQEMIDAGDGAAGVAFTVDTESGSDQVVVVTAAWGLGEAVVAGRVEPDEWLVHKATLRDGFDGIVRRRVGAKATRLVRDPGGSGHRVEPVPPEDRSRPCLTDDEVRTIARWALAVEEHATATAGRPTPMDVEFARAATGGLHLLQARPETVHAGEGGILTVHRLVGHGDELVRGTAVGSGIAVGPVRVVQDVAGIGAVRDGDVLVTSTTDPDWEPVLRRVAAVVTEHGGRTAHAAIVARELGVPAVVGAHGARAVLTDGAPVTVSCAGGDLGVVYAGVVPFAVDILDPARLPRTRARLLLNLADPGRAFVASRLPADGVGLARMEFVVASMLGAHPLAFLHRDRLDAADRALVDSLVAHAPSPEEYVVDTIAQAIATVAAAFWPRPVTVRLSDFKTDEYARLPGGAVFEVDEPNPMLGWRGASRYDHPDFRPAFLLEAAALARVRGDLGCTNVRLLVPFCRTPEEGARVLDALAGAGLRRGDAGLEVHVMAELPSNIVLADRFAELFDGFSLGTNDLTQLVLGVDRSAERVAGLFDEENEAVRRMCAQLIRTAHECGRPVSVCGQGPADHPGFAAFLVRAGIDALSVPPDAYPQVAETVAAAEASIGGAW
jgi:pyruvate,water dikinase